MPRVPKITPKAVEATMTPDKNRSWVVIFVLTTLLLLAVGIASYFYYQYHNTPQVKDAKEIEELVTTLGKVIVLPENETPTMATVTDKEKLAGQPFFQKSENGDKVLIYSQSGRAILYRPSTKKIVDVTAVNVNPQTTPAPASETPSAPAPENSPVVTEKNVKIAIYNGSGTVGVSNEMEKILRNFYPSATITTKETATAIYDDTLVVDVTSKNTVMAESLSFAAKGKVGQLPEGEKTPSGADFLVIIGKKH